MMKKIIIMLLPILLFCSLGLMVQQKLIEIDPIVKVITGLIKSDGTTISAAVAGSDYVASETDPCAMQYLDQSVKIAAEPNFGNANMHGNISRWTNDSGFISSYSETDPCVKAINGIVKSNGSTISAATSGTDYVSLDVSKFSGYQTDFIETTTSYNIFASWTAKAINTGTITAVAGTANHPGIMRITSSTTTNSGFEFRITTAAVLIAGNETSEFIFSLVTDVNTTVRMGFHDTSTVTAPTDGVYLKIIDDANLLASTATLTGQTVSNTSISTTASSYYTLATGTWYRAKIVINSDATQADFYLYLCTTGAELWHDNLTTNIPTATGREIGHSVTATNTNTVATNLLDMDYMNITINRTLVR